jgi:DNA repair protein RadD
MLRAYQRKALDDLYHWFETHDGHPCLVLPTGSGKSHVIAELCKEAIQNWPETKILMLTHMKELIEQNAQKLRMHWPNAPLGIFSAGIGRKELGEPITFAGIQSIKHHDVGHIDLCIIDECHLVSHKAEGTYRTFIEKLERNNPDLRVIGLTATPYRIGHGIITDDPAIFDDLIEPVTIAELQSQGYLADLRSKVTRSKLDVTGVHRRGGEYISNELQKAVDVTSKTEAVVEEVIDLAGIRRSWLFFCAGIEHARHVMDVLVSRGISAGCITGKTGKKEREKILESFKNKEIQALTNANVLTTGFDYPDIDLIVMMRPTLSPGLYVQMAGRGLRLKSHTDHCLVLDFAGVVETHGPITAVRVPGKGKEQGEGLPPSKICPRCDEIVAAQVRTCVHCGYEFPVTESHDLYLHSDDIMGNEMTSMTVLGWYWSPHVSKKSGKLMVKIIYMGALSDIPVTEYLCIYHDGYAGRKALGALRYIAANCRIELKENMSPEELCRVMTYAKAPDVISYRKEGKFFRVLERVWESTYEFNEEDMSSSFLDRRTG